MLPLCELLAFGYQVVSEIRGDCHRLLVSGDISHGIVFECTTTTLWWELAWIDGHLGVTWVIRIGVFCFVPKLETKTIW